MTDDLELSRLLTDIVSDVPGVTGVYPIGSLVQSVARGLVGGTLDERADEARVAVTRAAGGALSVAATIGVEAGHPVPDVLRAVGAAVRGVLETRDPAAPPPDIEVRASHIDTRGSGSARLP